MSEYNRLKVEYIRAPFINGSSAMQIEIEQQQRIQREKREKKLQPKPKHRRIYCFNIEPVSIVGAVMAKVLGTLLLLGFVDFLDAQKEFEAMENTLINVQNQNVLAEQQFREKVDLIQIEEMATGFGMIPASQAQIVTIYIDSSEKVEEKETIWDRWKWHWDMLWANVPPTRFVEEPADIIPTGPAPALEDLI